MNILRYGSHLLTESSPVGIIVGATALVLTVPPIRKGLRALAVVATRGVLSISDEAKRFTAESRENMEDILREAKDGETCCSSCSDFKESMVDLKTQPRRLAVAATMGVLTASDKAKTLYKDASKHMKGIVAEAKTTKASATLSETKNQDADFKIKDFPETTVLDEQAKNTANKEKDSSDKKKTDTSSESDESKPSKH